LSFINPARPIFIGDGCVIGGHCLIFTHSSSLNHLEGYPVEFAPIEIGNGVGIAWRSFVLPGTKIGDGTMVGANSVVSGTIPGCSMAVGFPARIVGRPPVFPKIVSDDEKVETFEKIVREMIEFFSGSGLQCARDGEVYIVREPKSAWGRARSWRMRVIDDEIRESLRQVEADRLDVLVSLREIPEDLRQHLSSRKIMWIDISAKAQPQFENDLGNEVLSFFRRYGVRTLRYPRK
jgi:hypothetical protein